MHPSHLTERFHNALHRAPKTLSNRELEEVVAVTLAAVAEMAVEMALVVSELAVRIDALEATKQPG